jgi:hypothetical protein
MLLAAPALAQNQDPAQLWADFNHYVRIARPDLAQAAASTLLQAVDNPTLLDIVEQSDYADDYDQTLDRGSRMEGLADVAAQLRQRIQTARIERSREPQRIEQDIALLAEGERPYRNAVARLTAAGQYAAPQMLATLQDPAKAQLHPYLITAMVGVGRPLVYPLSVALPQLPPATIRQVAQVLAEIGYPQPLPYLKQILEDSAVDAQTRRVVQVAYEKLLQTASLTVDLTAADLYLLLGQANFHDETTGKEIAGFDAAQGVGVVWEYGPRIGLVPVPVPGQIYGDVRAMREAERGLRIRPDLDAALSLYLMANLRRENQLGPDEVDPSYSRDMKPAAFYAMLAGPLRLHDVLSQALADGDAQLALDAIDALAKTAGTDALINRDGVKQPLLSALAFPDRRVRFRAAQALANARPDAPFAGSDRVVPVLGEAVRQSELRYGLVIAPDQQILNELLATVGDLGYEAFGGLSLSDVAGEVNARPGVDLIVTSGNVDAIEQLLGRTKDDYKLGSVPVLAVVTPGQQIDLQERLGDERRLQSTVAGDPEALAAAVEQITETMAGSALTAEQSTDFALTALALLGEIALNGQVYNVTDAQPAITAALNDPRQAVVAAAGMVLAVTPNAPAQQALADSALAYSGDVQLDLLASLADSATHFGNLLTDSQANKISALAESSEGDLAITAARAHGALTLPSSSAVQMIFKTR